MKANGLPKRSRLYLRRDIDTLFAQGESLRSYPIRCTYRLAEQGAFMVSVPKKLFKRAVDRNLLKRRMREAFRLNRGGLGGVSLHLSFHYTASERLPYARIEGAARDILEKLRQKFDNNSVGDGVD